LAAISGGVDRYGNVIDGSYRASDPYGTDPYATDNNYSPYTDTPYSTPPTQQPAPPAPTSYYNYPSQPVQPQYATYQPTNESDPSPAEPADPSTAAPGTTPPVGQTPPNSAPYVMGTNPTYDRVARYFMQVSAGAYKPTLYDVSQFGANIDDNYMSKIQGTIFNWWQNYSKNQAPAPTSTTGSTTTPPTQSPADFIKQWQGTHNASEGVNPLIDAMKAAGYNVGQWVDPSYGASHNEISLNGTKYKVIGAEDSPGAYWYIPGTSDAGPGGAPGSANPNTQAILSYLNGGGTFGGGASGPTSDPTFGPGPFSGLQSSAADLIQQMLANPGGIDDATAAKMKESQKEEALSAEDQLLSRLRTNEIRRGFDAGSGEANQRRTMQNAIQQILTGNRNVDVQQAQSKETGRVNALTSAGSFLSNLLDQQRLAELARQFNINTGYNYASLNNANAQNLIRTLLTS
jgi:hypothetical protein